MTTVRFLLVGSCPLPLTFAVLDYLTSIIQLFPSLTVLTWYLFYVRSWALTDSHENLFALFDIPLVVDSPRHAIRQVHENLGPLAARHGVAVGGVVDRPLHPLGVIPPYGLAQRLPVFLGPAIHGAQGEELGDVPAVPHGGGHWHLFGQI